MCPVNRAKRVVHVRISKRRELSAKPVVVLFFLGVKPKVFEEAYLSGSQVVYDLLCGIADAVLGQSDVLPEKLREPLGARLQTKLGVRPLLGSAQLTSAYKARSALDGMLDGRQAFANPRIVAALP